VTGETAYSLVAGIHPNSHWGWATGFPRWPWHGHEFQNIRLFLRMRRRAWKVWISAGTSFHKIDVSTDHFILQCFDAVGWALPAFKNRLHRRSDVLCVGWDVTP